MNATQFPRMYQHNMLIPWNKYLSCGVNANARLHTLNHATLLQPRRQASWLNLKNISNPENNAHPKHPCDLKVKGSWWEGYRPPWTSPSTGNSQLTNTLPLILPFDPPDNMGRWIGEILLPPILWTRKLGQRMTGSPRRQEENPHVFFFWLHQFHAVTGSANL